MILQSDVLPDIQGSVRFFCGKDVMEPGSSEPSFIDWKMKEASALLAQARMKTLAVDIPSIDFPSTSHHWNRAEKRWQRVRQSWSRLAATSDPSLSHVDQVFAKMKRLAVRDPESALAGWLKVEQEFWSWVHKTWAPRPEKVPLPVSAPRENTGEEFGIYNLELNAAQLREWLHRALPGFADSWELNWASFWSWWKGATTPAAQAPPALQPQHPVAGA